MKKNSRFYVEKEIRYGTKSDPLARCIRASIKLSIIRSDPPFADIFFFLRVAFPLYNASINAFCSVLSARVTINAAR